MAFPHGAPGGIRTRTPTVGVQTYVGAVRLQSGGVYPFRDGGEEWWR